MNSKTQLEEYIFGDFLKSRNLYRQSMGFGIYPAHLGELQLKEKSVYSIIEEVVSKNISGSTTVNDILAIFYRTRGIKKYYLTDLENTLAGCYSDFDFNTIEVRVE